LRRRDARAEIHAPADFGAIILPLAPDPASRPQAAESPHRQEEQSEASRFWSRARVWHPHAHVHARGACVARHAFSSDFHFLPDLTAGGKRVRILLYDDDRSSRCGTARPRYCSAPATTRPPSTCGRSDASLRRWSCAASRSSLATRKSTKSSRSSGQCPSLSRCTSLCLFGRQIADVIDLFVDA